jgi:hypothetical protein
MGLPGFLFGVGVEQGEWSLIDKKARSADRIFIPFAKVGIAFRTVWVYSYMRGTKVLLDRIPS